MLVNVLSLSLIFMLALGLSPRIHVVTGVVPSKNWDRPRHGIQHPASHRRIDTKEPQKVDLKNPMRFLSIFQWMIRMIKKPSKIKGFDASI